jgi:hypothetical protein
VHINLKNHNSGVYQYLLNILLFRNIFRKITFYTMKITIGSIKYKLCFSSVNSAFDI